VSGTVSRNTKIYGAKAHLPARNRANRAQESGWVRTRSPGEEWLALSDVESPEAPQLYFLGDSAPDAEAREILDEWWEEASSATPDGFSLLPNEYEPFGDVSLAKSRVMSLITHWYLSDDD
jgi:hypothetical protein